MMEIMCGDNRFEIIAKAKAHLLDATNIDTSEDEMKVLDDFLFRCWQMGWLDRYDRKTEPQRDCDNCKRKGCEGCEQPCLGCGWCDAYEPKDEPQTCSVNGRPYDCGNCEYHKCTADEPQTDELREAKILLKASRDLLNKQNETIYVLNLLEETVEYHGVECDGYCLIDDIDDWLALQTEPQTCSVNGRPYDCGNCEYHKCTADEPQAERSSE